MTLLFSNGCRPKPAYLEYVALRRTYEAYRAQLQKTGPEAMRRFHEWLNNSRGKNEGQK